MIKHICECGYIYNPAYGDLAGDVKAGTIFTELPKDWVCPICGLDKSHFHEEKKRKSAHFISLK